MDQVSSAFTVYFEDPFWVGVYERRENQSLQVCKITFGAEPKDYAVYQYLLSHWMDLKFSPPVSQQEQSLRCKNPKRLQRSIKKLLSRSGTGTKSQQALNQQREQSARSRRHANAARRQEQRDLAFALRKQKKKQKHSGH